MLRQRYIIALGLVAIVAALLVNLYVQYNSLSALQEAAPLARRASLERRLETIGSDAQEFYRERAHDQLNVPQRAILVDQVEDNVDDSFKDAPAEGVKRYFIASLGPGRKVKVTLYDPATRTRIKEQTPEGWSALFAASGFLGRARHNVVVDPDAVITSDEDPENPVIVRPIVDPESRAVGVAGMLIDRDYFREKRLPAALEEGLASRFSESELDALAFTVYDEKGNVVLSRGKAVAGEPDVDVPLRYVFSKWRLAARTVGPTHEALARRNFALNFSVTLLNTIVLVVVVALALRTADRSMKISQMKADFVSNVSHELRTPLSSIRVLGELLRTGRAVEPEKLRKYGEYIDTESRRLTQLINNILDFSKIESGKRDYRFEKLDLVDLVIDTLGTFEVRASQAGLEIDFEQLGPSLPPIRGDAEALEQVLSNLLDNAIKYSGQSKQIILQVGAEDGFAIVAVTDYGIGIPRDEQARVFERFHRVSTGLVHNVKGSGLGLSLVKHIVEAHGGHVTVTSEPGNGSTFAIRLPFDPSATAQTREKSPARTREPLELGMKE